MTTASRTDPVCGIRVSIAEAPGEHEYAGQAYYFCSQACQEKFRQNPSLFTAKLESTAGSFWSELHRRLLGRRRLAASEDDPAKLKSEEYQRT